MSAAPSNALPVWSWVLPLLSTGLLALLGSDLLFADRAWVLALAGVLLGGTVFSAVHHAEVIAFRLGEPFGSIVLAVAVTIIEVALIVSLMLSAKSGSDVLARDTVYATVMIVLNGIVGLCLVQGGARHFEQSFQTSAATAALSVLGTLAVITLVLPNYTLATSGPTFAPSQLAFVSVVSLVLYSVFLYVQTIRHRDYFLSSEAAQQDAAATHALPSTRLALAALLFLCLSLAGVVLLAKALSPAIETVIEAASLPKSMVGVVIAAVVLLPEGLSAVRAAHQNRLQTSLNLALGSAMATIGLTIPVVSAVSLMIGIPLTLGLGPDDMVLLILSLFIATVSLATGRTTILQGAVHLVIFAVFLFLAAVP